MDQDISFGVQYALWMDSNWGYLFILAFLITGALLLFFKNLYFSQAALTVSAAIILVPIVFFVPVINEEEQKYQHLVMQEVAREYGLNIDGVDSIKCVSGKWHYQVGDSWRLFDPEVSCEDDRGLDVRFNEKWPY